MEYRISQRSGGWVVYSGTLKHGDWFIEGTVFSHPTIAECYAWIKAKQEGLLLI
jgi:hypothetical protein